MRAWAVCLLKRGGDAERLTGGKLGEYQRPSERLYRGKGREVGRGEELGRNGGDVWAKLSTGMMESYPQAVQKGAEAGRAGESRECYRCINVWGKSYPQSYPQGVEYIGSRYIHRRYSKICLCQRAHIIGGYPPGGVYEGVQPAVRHSLPVGVRYGLYIAAIQQERQQDSATQGHQHRAHQRRTAMQ